MTQLKSTSSPVRAPKSVLRSVLLHPFFWLAAVPFFVAVLVINPMNTVGFRDDDWANARTTERFYETGVYQLDNWLAPHIVTQVVWGSLFMRVFGESHGSLYLSQLVLFAISIVALYRLAREHQIGGGLASLICLTYMGSQSVLTGGFSYMSDIPAACFQFLALWLWTHGLRVSPAPVRPALWMLAGGAAAAAGILIRPQNLALLGGLGLLMLWERRRWSLYAVGLLPGFISTGILALLSREFNWAQQSVQARSAAYIRFFLEQPIRLFTVNVGRVMAVIAQLAIHIFPVSIWGIFAQRFSFRTSRRWIISVLAMLLCIAVGTYLYTNAIQTRPRFPYIELMSSVYNEEFVSWLITFTSWVFGGSLLWSLYYCFYNGRYNRDVNFHLLQTHAACAILFILVSDYLYDRYLISLLPISLVIVGRVVSQNTTSFLETTGTKRTYRIVRTTVIAVAIMIFAFNLFITLAQLRVLSILWGNSCYWPYNGYSGRFDEYIQSNPPENGVGEWFEQVSNCQPAGDTSP